MKKQTRKKTSKKIKTQEQKECILGLHNLKIPGGAHKRKKMKGRGSSSGHGKTSTRGSKGQTSRAGRHFYLGFEGGQMPLIRKIPKRGFTNIFKHEFQIINIENLAKIKDSPVTLEILQKQGLIKTKEIPVKLLGDGEIKHALTIQVHAASKKASEKITAAGGKVEIINA